VKGSEGLSVIVRSGDYESAHYALALAAAALAVNKKAVLFFTMGGLRALQGPPAPLDGWDRDAVHRQRGVGDFETLLAACVELGARWACARSASRPGTCAATSPSRWRASSPCWKKPGRACTWSRSRELQETS